MDNLETPYDEDVEFIECKVSQPKLAKLIRNIVCFSHRLTLALSCVHSFAT